MNTAIPQNHLLSIGLKADDIYSLNLLQPLLIDYPLLPFTAFSFRPFCLSYLLNDIVINGRRNIIEFGSGLSTVLIGRLCKKNNLPATLLSVDHNEDWVNAMKEMLRNEKLDDIIELVYAPLKQHPCYEHLNWYDTDVIDRQTSNREFDMVIVDGPPAWEKGNEKVRHPALSYMKKKLSDRFSLYLDDVNRPGEQAVIKLWEEEYGFKFSIAGGTLAYYKTGNSFCTDPF